MQSEAYVAGVLDALVKAGEVSPAYACGMFDALEKRAWLPEAGTVASYANPITGIPMMAYNGIKSIPSMFRTNTENANRYLSSSGVQPGDRKATDYEKAIQAGTHWYDGGGTRAWNYVSNRFMKNVAAPVGNFFGANMGDDAYYDNQLAQRQWAERMSRFKPDEGMDLGLAGYMQTKANQTTNAAILDNKRLGVSDAETRAQYGSSQVGQHYGSQAGNAALQSGAYKTDYEHAGPKPGATTTGAGVVAQTGTPGSHRVDGFDGMDSIWRTRRTM